MPAEIGIQKYLKTLYSPYSPACTEMMISE